MKNLIILLFVIGVTTNLTAQGFVDAILIKKDGSQTQGLVESNFRTGTKKLKFKVNKKAKTQSIQSESLRYLIIKKGGVELMLKYTNWFQPNFTLTKTVEKDKKFWLVVLNRCPAMEVMSHVSAIKSSKDELTFIYDPDTKRYTFVQRAEERIPTVVAQLLDPYNPDRSSMFNDVNKDLFKNYLESGGDDFDLPAELNLRFIYKVANTKCD